MKMVIKTLAKIKPEAAVFDLKAEDFSRDPDVVADVKGKDPLVYTPKHSARLAANIIANVEDIKKHEQELDVPLLIFHGSADKVTPPAGSKRLAANAKAPDKTLKILPGFVHDLAHEPEPNPFIPTIVDWTSQRAIPR